MRAEQGDFWLGFTGEQMAQMLRDCGFARVRRLVAGSDPSHDRLSAVVWSCS